MAGQQPVAQNIAIGGLGKQLYADTAPSLRDELKDVEFFLVLAGGLDDDLQRPTVG